MLAWLNRHRDQDVIKIVTGVRGCGKSYLLDRYTEELVVSGVPRNAVLRFDFEHPLHRHLHTPEDLMDLVDAQAPADGRVYILLDEICELQEFDAALGGLFAIKRFDIVATCSNRRPMSERFREYLSGSFVHVEMMTPSFLEIPIDADTPFERRLGDCLRYGALPYTSRLRDSPLDAAVYLGGLWNTILVKDILTRNRMSDSRFTERLLERIYDHLGETESLRKIAADATIDGHEAAPNTVLSYIEALDESMLVRRVPKFDAFLGETAKGGYRFYLADFALGRNRYGDFPGDPTNALRNLIFLELIGRGGAVSCGRYDGDDFDFVVVRDGQTHCFQFAPVVVNGHVPAAVLGPFKRMPRDIPKTVIVRGVLPRKRPPDIEFVTLEQFLTGKD